MISTEPEMIIDNKTIKVLSVDTRIKILKLLKKRDYTLSEISKELSLANSTTKEHLDKLIEVNLIEKEKTDRKWKYYSLTRKGNRLSNRKESKIIFILFATLLLSFLTIFSYNFIDFNSYDMVGERMPMVRTVLNSMEDNEDIEQIDSIITKVASFSAMNEENLSEEKSMNKLKEIILYIFSLIFVLLSGIFVGILFEKRKNQQVLNK